MPVRLVLFAKRPRPGRVKTRLVPPLLPREALELYRAFVADQLLLLDRLRNEAEIELCSDEGWTPEEEGFDPLADLRIARQTHGDLGRRLLHAFARIRAEDRSAALVIGADAPTLPESFVRTALHRLRDGAPAVVSPAEDGGYVMLGLSEPVAELFQDVPWGGPHVLDITRLRARSAGIAWFEIDPWYDVDDARALARLRGDLAPTRKEARRRAPATANLLDRLPPRPTSCSGTFP